MNALAELPTGASLDLSPAPQEPSPYRNTMPFPSMDDGRPLKGRPIWSDGQIVWQGFLGASTYNNVELDNGGATTVDGDSGDLDTLPLIGGGGQYKVGGERIDWGMEGFFSFGGRANASAFVVGGGGAAVAVDVDLLVFDLYGGLFASTFLGEKLRIYAGAGPLLEWADYDQTESGVDTDGSGFGAGGYARAGFEFVLASHTMAGFGARWSDCTIDLGDELGDLELQGFQIFFTLSRGL